MDVQSYLDVPAGDARFEFIEQLERQSLRQLTQGIQELSRYFKDLFDNTPIPYGVSRTAHLARLTEHLVRRAVDRASIQPLDDYYEGDFDSRRVRWCPTTIGAVAQDLRVDAKAESERSRLRPSASQYSMRAHIEVTNRAGVTRTVRQDRIVPPHILLPTQIDTDHAPASTDRVAAITTVLFVALFYKPKLRSIILIASPHQELQERYNPSPGINHIWQAGPGVDDARATRINLKLLQANPYSPWRVQELVYPDQDQLSFTRPIWVDGPPRAEHKFAFVPGT
jgi:hypothetical protein